MLTKVNKHKPVFFSTGQMSSFRNSWNSNANRNFVNLTTQYSWCPNDGNIRFPREQG